MRAPETGKSWARIPQKESPMNVSRPNDNGATPRALSPQKTPQGSEPEGNGLVHDCPECERLANEYVTAHGLDAYRALVAEFLNDTERGAS
jgi:hypothetical protein